MSSSSSQPTVVRDPLPADSLPNNAAIESEPAANETQEESLQIGPTVREASSEVSITAALPTQQLPSANPENVGETIKKRRRNRRWLGASSPWNLEFWSTILAFVGFASIVVVLGYYNDKPQSDWPYSSLTINGLVALLASVTRASLLVGVAAAIGQGKWNWFIGRAKSTEPMHHDRALADFEIFDDASRAFITILLLGFDTFAQQISTIHFRNDLALGQAALPSVPRSEYYDSSHFISQQSDYTSVVDSLTKSAVYNGIMNQNLTQLPVTCSTGNCSWPIIPTVAVCGACVDLTANITNSCSDGYCNYTLPNGATLDGHIEEIELSDIAARRNYFKLWSPLPQQPLSREWTDTIPEVPSYIALFQSLGPAYPAQDLRTVTAAECGLWLCLQSWNVSVENGRASSQLLSQYHSARADSVFDYNFTSIPFERFNIDPQTDGYGASKASLGAIADSVSMYTYGNVTGFQMASVPGVTNSWIYDVSSDTIQGFWQASGSQPDYQAFIDNLATSISNNMRQTSAAPSTNSFTGYNYTGTASSSRSYVRVRWAWITYPAVMTLVSPLFLLLTALQAKRRKVNVWKSSALAALFSTVGDEDVQRLANEHADNTGTLLRALKDERMRIGDRTGGLSGTREGFWRFSRV